jgi:hypothetical protein
MNIARDATALIGRTPLVLLNLTTIDAAAIQ